MLALYPVPFNSSVLVKPSETPLIIFATIDLVVPQLGSFLELSSLGEELNKHSISVYYCSHFFWEKREESYSGNFWSEYTSYNKQHLLFTNSINSSSCASLVPSPLASPTIPEGGSYNTSLIINRG